MSAIFPASDVLVEPAPEAVGLVDRIEDAACFVILLLLSGALLAPLFSPDQNPDAVPWLRTIWLPADAAVAVMVLRRPLQLSRVAIGAAMSLILCGWAFASSRWSIQPDVTSRRAVALLFTTLFGLHLAASRDWRRLAELFAGVFLVLVVGTYIACIGFPRFGRNDSAHPGAWSGLWYEKNQLGRLLTHGALVSTCAALFAPERRRLWIAGAVLCVGAVVMSRSTTSLLGVGVLFGGMALIALLRRGGWVRLATVWAMVAGGGGFLCIMAFAPALFFAMIGKDPSLTGRTDIWAAVLRQVALHPLAGWGYGAFWSDLWGPAWFIRHEVQWTAPTAHDGWLDILLQLGVIGLVLSALHFLVSAGAALWRLNKGNEAYWAISVMALFALFSVSESTVMQYNEITWTLYIATMAKLFEGPGFATGPTPRASGVKLFPDEDWV